MEESTTIHIVHVINKTKSEIIIQKKSDSTFRISIPAGSVGEVNTDFFDLLFNFLPGQRIVSKLVKHEGITPHIDVEVGHPDTETGED